MPTWSDFMTSPAEYILSTAAVITALIVIIAAGWQIAKFVRRVTHFLDDWGGEEARPGVAARPGAMARLATVEERLDDVELDTRQLRRNGGAHLADAVARVEAALTGGQQPPAPAADTPGDGS